MKNYESLKIDGVLLDEEHLKNYLEKIALQHLVTKKSNKITYPIPQMIENYYIIKNVYQLLNEHIRLGIHIHPAGEWIQETINHLLMKHLRRKQRSRLLRSL